MSSTNHQTWTLRLFTLQFFFQRQRLLQLRERTRSHLQQHLQSQRVFRFNLVQDDPNPTTSQEKSHTSPIRIRSQYAQLTQRRRSRDLWEGHPEEADPELQLLQDLKRGEWYQGDLPGFSEKVKKAIKKELISVRSSGHKYDPVPHRLLSHEDQAKIIESRRAIGPRSGTVLSRPASLAKASVKSLARKQRYTPQATTLNLLDDESTSQMGPSGFRCCFSIAQHTCGRVKRGLIFVEAPKEIQYPEPTVWRLKRQFYGHRDSPRKWQIHLTQVLQRMGLSPMKSDPCAFARCDSSGNVNLIVMAYIDDLVVSVELSSSVSSTLNTSRQITPVKFLGRIIKKNRSGWHQLRDGVKYPVKDRSRSLSKFQESDAENQSQASPQVCQSDQRFHLCRGPSSTSSEFQGFSPVQIVTYVLHQYCFDCNCRDLSCHSLWLDVRPSI